jgi:hypothetical protein
MIQGCIIAGMKHPGVLPFTRQGCRSRLPEEASPYNLAADPPIIHRPDVRTSRYLGPSDRAITDDANFQVHASCDDAPWRSGGSDAQPGTPDFTLNNDTTLRFSNCYIDTWDRWVRFVISG